MGRDTRSSHPACEQGTIRQGSEDAGFKRQIPQYARQERYTEERQYLFRAYMVRLLWGRFYGFSGQAPCVRVSVGQIWLPERAQDKDLQCEIYLGHGAGRISAKLHPERDKCSKELRPDKIPR